MMTSDMSMEYDLYYSGNKFNLDEINTLPSEFDFPKWNYPVYKYVYIEKEKEMDTPPKLVERYKNLNLNKDEKQARIWGAIDEQGRLTESGRELLLEILFNDPDIRKKFFDAIKSIDKANPETKEDK